MGEKGSDRKDGEKNGKYEKVHLEIRKERLKGRKVNTDGEELQMLETSFFTEKEGKKWAEERVEKCFR